jgi:hypothetical protein
MRCGWGNILQANPTLVVPTPTLPQAGEGAQCAELLYPAAAFFGATLTASLP